MVRVKKDNNFEVMVFIGFLVVRRSNNLVQVEDVPFNRTTSENFNSVLRNSNNVI